MRILSLVSRTSTASSARSGMQTSTSKCPALHRSTPSFMRIKCSLRMTFVFPVTVTKTSPIFDASSMSITSNPSISASSALCGSISTTITLAPSPAALFAAPFPHHPYPAMTTFLPATIRLVVLSIASQTDCPVPYRLSKRYLLCASFTASIGKGSSPSHCIDLRRFMPVVVSSHPPSICGMRSLRFSTIIETTSPPSSIII